MDHVTKKNCPFCRMTEGDLEYVALLEEKDVFAVMDLYPATTGHVLVLPKRHIETIYEMPVELGCRIMSTAIRVAKAIKETLSPDGINLIQSNGTAAGQAISHFHLHVVPRYAGDPVLLQFGHGNKSERLSELKRIASLVKSGFIRQREETL
jgi:histidine triad (HIT) family protein